MSHNAGFQKLVDTAKKEIRELTLAEVRKMQVEGKNFHLVDTREDTEWAASRIPGSIHLGKGVIERDIEDEISDRHAEIVLYCGGGFRSALAAQALKQMGYTRVFSMDGGIRGWREAGYPEDKSPA